MYFVSRKDANMQTSVLQRQIDFFKIAIIIRTMPLFDFTILIKR